MGKPVNVVVGLAGNFASVAELAAAGVKRISVGSALARAALGGFLRAAREMQDRGTFEELRKAEPYAVLQTFMAKPSAGV